MSQKTLLALVIAAVLALAGGWYFGTATRPDPTVAMDTGRLMFPGLTAKLPAARRIEITSKGRTTVIESGKDGVWGIADRGGYPVLDTKLRGMLTTLTELRLVEPRTADPSQFARLGVEDPTTGKDGTATLLRVLDDKGQPIVAVIAGHRRMRTQGHVPEQVYVRLPGDNQAWLAEGGLQADTDPQVWLNRDVLNIAHDLIARVVATRNGETVEFVRDGEKLKVVKPANPPKLDDYKLDDVARALESLTFQDVKPATEPLGEKAGESVFTTSDGLEITAAVSHLDKDSWTRFTVAAPERGKPEAERLNAKLAGWAFQTGAWKDKSLIPTIEDLKAPPPEATPAATPAPGMTPAPLGVPPAVPETPAAPSAGQAPPPAPSRTAPPPPPERMPQASEAPPQAQSGAPAPERTAAPPSAAPSVDQSPPQPPTQPAPAPEQAPKP